MDQAALNVTGSFTILTKWYFYSHNINMVQYKTFFFVVGPKQSNDAKEEEMNSLGRNEMYDENT